MRARGTGWTPGFTLIEMMVVIALLAILSAIAIPRFQTIIQNNRITSVNNDFIGAMGLARAEAIKRGESVNVSAVGGDWSAGWRVWVEQGGGAGFSAADDRLLRLRESLPQAVTLASPGSVVRFTYEANGRVDTSGELELCDDRVGSFGRRIRITATGRVNSSGELQCP